ncbi:MAG: hypothetical protein QXH81_00805 [Thermofilaceae archaeon]
MNAHRFNPEIYRDYARLQKIVVETLANMISATKGSMLTFNAKKIASEAGLPTHPVVLTLIKEVIEQLRAQGLVRRLSKTAHGVKYAVNRESPLWFLAKQGELTGNLESVLAKIKLVTYVK